MALHDPRSLDQPIAPRWILGAALLILVALALLAMATLAGVLPFGSAGGEGAIWLWRWDVWRLV